MHVSASTKQDIVKGCIELHLHLQTTEDMLDFRYY